MNSADNSETKTNEVGETVQNDSFHQVYDHINAISGVKSVTFSSKDDQLAKLKETYGDDWAMFDGDSNPLQDVYVVEATSASKVKKLLRRFQTLKVLNQLTMVVQTQTNSSKFLNSSAHGDLQEQFFL